MFPQSPSTLLRVAACLLAATTLPAQSTIPETPDVNFYGEASGQIPSPTSRTSMFGFPVPGATVELQVIGARPHTKATFYIATAADDIQLPGLGRLLVDMSTAISYQTTVDGQGRASIPFTIPNGAQSGDEQFVQCFTTDTASPSPTTELASAVNFQLGEAAKTVVNVSNLVGEITVTSNGTPVSSNDLSGIYAVEWGPRTADRVTAGVVVDTITSSITVRGELVEDLRVQSIGQSSPIVWSADDFLTVPTSTTDKFLVNYTHQNKDYGPYTVSGQVSASIGDVDVRLDPLPGGNNGPLAGAAIDLDMTETLLDPRYFTEIQYSGLPDPTQDPASITPQDAANQFVRADALMTSMLASLHSATGYYNGDMPTYHQFVADEAEILLILTNGMASTAVGLHEMVSNSIITQRESFATLLASKLLAASGVKKGVKGFNEAFLDTFGDQLDEIARDLDAKEYKKAAKGIGKIFKGIVGKEFRKALGDKVGRKLAGEILAKIGARCIPLIGWGIFGVSLLWALVEQWND